MSTELKDLVRQDLNKIKEEEIKKEKEINSKLKEVDLYWTSKSGSTLHTLYTKYFDENGIKYNLKEIHDHPEVSSLVMGFATPIIAVNGEYLVYGRDFKSPPPLVKILRVIADPNFIQVDPNAKLIEMLKNTNRLINQNFQRMAQMIQPIVKVMQSLEAEEKKENAKKNN